MKNYVKILYLLFSFILLLFIFISNFKPNILNTNEKIAFSSSSELAENYLLTSNSNNEEIIYNEIDEISKYLELKENLDELNSLIIPTNLIGYSVFNEPPAPVSFSEKTQDKYNFYEVYVESMEDDYYYGVYYNKESCERILESHMYKVDYSLLNEVDGKLFQHTKTSERKWFKFDKNNIPTQIGDYIPILILSSREVIIRRNITDNSIINKLTKYYSIVKFEIENDQMFKISQDEVNSGLKLIGDQNQLLNDDNKYALNTFLYESMYFPLEMIDIVMVNDTLCLKLYCGKANNLLEGLKKIPSENYDQIMNTLVGEFKDNNYNYFNIEQLINVLFL